MGFWFFMLAVCLLIPIMMLGFGAAFSKSSPKNINYLFGYRTARSMKTEQTWVFAHKLMGKIWKVLGLILLPLSLIALLFVLGKSEDTMGTVGMVVCYVELAALIFSILPVERALKRNFDDDGNKK